MNSSQKPIKIKKVILRVPLSALVLAIGVAGLITFANMKSPPAEIRYAERPLRVEIVEVFPEDVTVFITGYGETRALDVVEIAPEVSGKIVAIHPRLEAGEVIEKGDLLFKVEPRDDLAAVSKAKATVEQWKNTIARLEDKKTSIRNG